MIDPHSSPQLITGMRALAKGLFATGVNALSPVGSGKLHFHPKAAQLACLQAVQDAAFEYCQTVVVTQPAIAGDAAISACELLKLAEDADAIDGSVAIVLGRSKSGPCNKRLALNFALAAATARLHRPWIFLSGMTGDQHCRYRSAGAIVDSGTCSWIWPLGRQPDGRTVDPTSLLAESGDLLLADRCASYAMNLDLILLA